MTAASATTLFQAELDRAIERYVGASCDEERAAVLDTVRTIRSLSLVQAKVGRTAVDVVDDVLDFSGLPDDAFYQLVCEEQIPDLVVPSLDAQRAA